MSPSEQRNVALVFQLHASKYSILCSCISVAREWVLYTVQLYFCCTRVSTLHCAVVKNCFYLCNNNPAEHFHLLAIDTIVFWYVIFWVNSKQFGGTNFIIFSKRLAKLVGRGGVLLGAWVCQNFTIVFTLAAKQNTLTILKPRVSVCMQAALILIVDINNYYIEFLTCKLQVSWK